MHKTGGFLHIQRILKRDTKRARRDKECAPQHSAARGMMAVRKLIIFKHDSELGEAPAWKLFKLVDVQRKPEIAAPRSFEDYQFSVDTDHLPQGVTCQIME